MTPSYKFGNFLLKSIHGCWVLFENGKRVSLEPQEAKGLWALVQKRGEYLSLEQIIGLVWPNDSTKGSNNVQVMVAHLRPHVGGENAIPRKDPQRGYFFKLPVEVIENIDENASLVSADTNEGNGLGTPATLTDLFGRNETVILAERDQDNRPDTPATQIDKIDDSGSVGRTNTDAPRWKIQIPIVTISVAVTVLGLTLVLPRKDRITVSVDQAVGVAAVLPFTVSGENGQDKDLGIATADTITTKLGLAGVPVLPFSAVQRYPDISDDPQTFARRLGATFVVDGKIQCVGEHVRIVVHAAKVGGAQLWAANFDAKRSEIFAIQDVIARKIAEGVGPKLTDKQNKLLVRHSTENDDAYLAYENGRYHWNKRTVHALQDAKRYFQSAIDLDPSYALAYSGLADTYSMLGLYTAGRPNDLYREATKNAKRALELDDNSAEAHASLGLVYLYHDWDGPAAEAEFKRSLEINPNYSHVHMWQGINFTAMGRFAEAKTELERAKELDALSPIINAASGLPWCFHGDYPQAIERFKKGLELDQNFARAEFYLGVAYEQQGLHQQAVAELEKAVQFSQGNAEYQGLLGHAYAMAGNLAQARNVLKDLERRRSRKEYIPAFAMALVYKGLGERDLALEWLEKALDDRSNGMIFLRVDPLFNDFRSDPSYKRLVEQIDKVSSGRFAEVSR